MKVNLELNAWSLGATVAVITAAIVRGQADLRGLEESGRRHWEAIGAERAESARQVRQGDGRLDRDRAAIVALQGDIRMVRLILERAGQAPVPFAPQ